MEFKGNIGFTDMPVEAVDNDCLGMSGYVDALSEFIAHCNTPITIAIQGDWGTGKTSAMKMIIRRLNAIDKKIICREFNTWQFSQFDLQDDVPLIMLKELLEVIGCEDGELKKLFITIGKNVGKVGLRVIGSLVSAPLSAQETDAIFRDGDADPVRMIKELKGKLQKAVSDMLDREKASRLVFFVDDLDRMRPARAVELLEVMKNFLDIRDCVFVLAVDYEVVSRGVREKYGQDMDEAKGRSFFDKIIQLPFNLPVSLYDTSKYLKSILDAPEDMLARYNELAASSVGTNPRALKRMANTMKLLEILAAKNSLLHINKEVFRLLLFAILCMQTAYEPVYLKMLNGDIRNKFLDASPEGRVDLFTESFPKDADKREEHARKLERFFEALAKSLPDGDEGMDTFSAAMNLTGITAANSQNSLIAVAETANSFDSQLTTGMAQLCAILKKEHKRLWDMLGCEPYFQTADNKLNVPLIFGGIVFFIIQSRKDGMAAEFYTQYIAPMVKQPFYELLKKKVPDLIKGLPYSGRPGAFLEFPLQPWAAPAGVNTSEASQLRYNQVKYFLNQTMSAILPVIEQFDREKEPVIREIDDFVCRIMARLKKIFDAGKGWELKKGVPGVWFIPWQPIITIRQTSWKECVNLYLTGDKLLSKVCLAFSVGKLMPSLMADPQTKKIWELILQNIRGKFEEKDLDLVRYDNDVVLISLPKGIDSWTSGWFWSDDYAFRLTPAEQEEAISTISKYGEIFLSQEDLMDKLAE